MKDPLLDLLQLNTGSEMGATPRNVRMPAEWEPMDGVWLSWPTAEGLWADNRESAEVSLANLVTVLTRFAPVFINCRKSSRHHAEMRLRAAGVALERVKIFDIPTNDVWCRDHGPTFLQDIDKGKLCAVSWHYNGWGGKFPHELDADVAVNMTYALLVPCLQSELTCEGGALEVNSRGTLLTTESVLLNANRNADWSRKDIEAELIRCLGVKEVVWLKEGLAGDDTDGHIDMLARFFSDDGVVTIRRKDSRAADYRALEENYEILSSLRTPTGGRYDIATLPLPEPLNYDGWRYEQVPVSYANFLILNHGVIAPTYGCDKEDRAALGLLAELFPQHEIAAFPSRTIIQEGGAIHCLTQQQPAPKLP